MFVNSIIRRPHETGDAAAKELTFVNVSNYLPPFPLFPLTLPGQLCEQYPMLEETAAIDILVPKKAEVKMAKW